MLNYEVGLFVVNISLMDTAYGVDKVQDHIQRIPFALPSPDIRASADTSVSKLTIMNEYIRSRVGLEMHAKNIQPHWTLSGRIRRQLLSNNTPSRSDIDHVVISGDEVRLISG